MKFIDLDGLRAPALGFGTFTLQGETCRRAVRTALDVGYRHIDTARMYENEAEVGAAIRESGMPREDLFVTTKVWFDDLSPEGVERQITDSLRRLDTRYLDLVLVHWPNPEFPLERTLEALQGQIQRERTRRIGVSNFTPALVDRAAQYATIHCNQVEYHPLLDQSRLLESARRHRMMLTAYSPLAQGKVLDLEPVREIARRLDRKSSQVVLRWFLQQEGVAAIPRSSDPDHIRTNFEILDFELTDDDMETLSGMARGVRIVDPEWAPAWGS